jgi:WD40 repeat protein
LGELANASLLIPTNERTRRYRYHDRVRDFALGKQTLPPEEVRRRRLGCFADWDTVKAEFEAVGAFALAEQYLRLREGEAAVPADLAPWYHFVRGQASVLGSYPELFFQQAFNEPVESPVSRAAQERVGTAEVPERWLEWLNRPREFEPPACVQVFTGHAGEVYSVAVSADGRTAVSGSYDRSVRVWDLAGGQCLAVHSHDSQEAAKAWSRVRTDRSFTGRTTSHFLTLRSTCDGAVVARFPGQFQSEDCSPDGRFVFATDANGQVYFLRLRCRGE